MSAASPESGLLKTRFLKSIFARIGLITFSILIGALSILFYHLTHKAVDSSNKSKLVTAELSAQAVLDKIDRNFYERFGDVQAFAFNTLAVQTVKHDSVSPAMQTFINTMTAYYVLYDLMMVCDQSGQVLVTNTKDKAGNSIDNSYFMRQNYSSEPWFQRCTSKTGPEGGAWYSDFLANPHIGRMYGDNKGYGMAFAAPIRDENGEVLGVWYNFASWKEVTEDIRRETENNLQANDSAALVFITRENGEIISATDQRLIAQKRVLRPVDLEAGIAGNLGSDDQESEQEYIFASSNSRGAYTYKGKGWKSITLIPKATVSWAVFFSSDNFPAIAAALLLMTMLSYFIVRFVKTHVVKRMSFIGSVLKRLARGEAVDVPASLISDDEIGSMIVPLSGLAETMKAKADFADEIAKGNLNASLQSIDKADILGNSLVNMRNQLQIVSEEDKQRTWSAEGIAQLETILRANRSSAAIFDEIIKFAVRYTKANQGALFRAVKKDQEELLELVTCYAYDKKKFLEKTIAFGNGLIGQCAMEKTPVYLIDIPEGYIQISSGLGEAKPRSLLIVPLMADQDLMGVLEIASFQPFKKFEIEFLEKLAESVAAAVASITTAETTRLLLEEAQRQAEEMNSQQEEMRQNMEELSATQEEMARKEREYLDRIRALEKAMEKMSV
jgi:FtsZ-binding cell division protein ZapB